MDAGVYDPKAQVKAVAAELKSMNTTRLLEAVDVMSTSLVMGFEGYLRKFDSATAIPLLADVCETFIREAAQGDLLVMALRALSLIMEHVPSSYEAAQGFHVSLMQLASQAIHRALCTEWKFVQSNNALMIEEGLRVMRFVSKDDMTGEIIHHALVGDLLTLCTDPHPLVARQALETLLMVSSKVVMPSELEKRTHSFAAGILSFFKSKKKSSRTGSDTGKAGQTSVSSGSSSTKAAAAEDIVPYADHPTVAQVENVIVPLLVSLIEQYAKSFTSIPEHWALLELSLQCLGTLIERALICHRPHTARALASPLLPKILFQLILDTESNVTLEPSVRVDRLLLCETTLTLLTYCHRYLILESLQLPEARRFFRLILEDSTEEITTLLDDPFPRAVIATRSTQRRDKDHITSIAALQLFVLACPTVPPNAFGLKPKLVLPVHQWMWEDELRHNNRLMEEQCLSLERSWTRLDHRARISVHLKHLNVDLHTMTMSKAAGGGHRNVCRSYVPFVYHFADEMTLRPIVAVKEAGPCAEDGTMLTWKPTVSGTHGSKTAASASIAKQVDGNTSGSSWAKRSRRKGVSTPSLSEGEVTNATDSAPSTVVLNTQVEVPEDHVSLAEEYFGFLCVFAKNTSGQMAKQVATCACASMLQLMFLSGASARFEGLMATAVLPMCEMCREALISADKATKAVVLTMIEWMLYHPMAEPCQFTESALRCGLLDQLDMLSKTTLLVRSKPTRTATLVEKASALVGCIAEKIENRRAAHVGGAGINASVGSKTTLGDAFLSTTMLRVQTVLDELRLCHCGAVKGTVAATSSSRTSIAIAADKNGSPTRAIKALADTHESAIRELLRIFQESNDITAFEVFTAGVASTLLYYLLGDRTLEDMLGGTLVFASGASASTLRHETVPLSEVHTGPIDRNTSSWTAMMASGMHVADILAMYVVEKRLRCFIQCAVAYPIGMRRLVHTLTANLSLQSYLPLVESVVTYDKVVCKTPLQAYHALSVISPLIALCGDAGRRISAAIKTATDDDAVPLPRSSSSATAAGDASAPAASSSNGTEPKQRKTSLLASSFVRSRTASWRANDPTKVARMAKECCMAGHPLHHMEHYPQLRRCDKCNRIISSGRSCRTCNYDVCQNCYPGYTGNVNLIRSLSTMERNRVHLCATIGDVERWFRTGSTSTKGTESAPTSQSSLHHLERFTTRVLTFLKRYTSVLDLSAVSIIPHASGATASNLLACASPAASSDLLVKLAEKLLSHPSVVRRLTYKYLSQFSTRGALMDEGTPITPDVAATLDVEVQRVLSTAAERHAAESIVQEAVEERYILYRTSCGMLPFQETVLSTLYRRAFALGDHQVLLQLENCLLRADSTVEGPLTLQANSSVTIENPAALSIRFNANVKVTKKAKSVKSPLAVAGACSSSAAAATAAGEPVMTSVEKSAEAREFDGHRVGLDQTYLFHHFESDSAAFCACGAHSRADFHTEEPPALTFTPPAFAHRADMLLLIILHRALFEETHGLIAYAGEARDIFGTDDSIFQNNTITTALVRSLEASALRVSLLPPRYALPRWVNFLLREGRFLIPLSVRERASRFLAYGARRAFIQHMRVFRSQRNDRAVLILPGEWAKLSNHKFAVSRDAFARDAYTMLRKCCDARFPISIEFKGDVGVGQGPTAQFYTLLAAEASKCCTRLWRDSDDKANGSSNNAAAVSNSSAGIVMATGPLMVGPPPKGLPPRRSSVTPITSPPRIGTSRPGSVTNGAGGTVSTPRLGSIPTQSSLRNFARADSAHLTTPSATLSPSPSMTTAAEADAVLIPPPEGFYPRHMDGVRRYLEDIDSFPATPLLCCSHTHTVHDDSATHALSQSSSEHFGSTTTRKGPAFTDHASTAGAGGHRTNINSFNAFAVQYDLSKAAFLVDRNVGLMRDYVLEQRERAKAYYVIGAALGRAFVDEQVFPLPLSRAVAYFIRRGVPAYQCVVSDVTHIDPPPEYPIDLFELPLTAASWVDQGIADSLACLSTMDSSTLAALDLRFTLPGDDSVELCPDGAQIPVTKKNLRLYQRRVVGALLYESVAVPLYFLTMGCRDVVPHEALTVMDVKELIGVLCGEDKNPSDPLWTTEEIRSVLVGDHGYRNDSPQLELLAKVLGQRLTPAEQREFLLFCTGCPRLPIGGIRALGAITVVRRSNAFVDEHTEALRGEAAAATTSSSGGGGTLDMEGEEDDGGGGLMGGLYDHTAQSDVEDSPSGKREAPHRMFSPVYPAASEEPGGMSSSFVFHLPESEWALPSVNTCFRYLKLPPYPSEELLYKKLLMSIMESGSSFELS
ncbi:conserved hypothetical protein [Leishmania infantum JPCM5]|uniref:Uncharacterized protein n=2 Tax=Leishmania infantum TaxID=5671 RepID=A4IBF5_LEIIN|nr:conserved hypothetical protein [Leishmania infantum JPCM5]CAC9544944.1 ubiquitin-protein_ligase_-_putative [Leishmania infantum]CAM72173.2 conserved hypothetical protein [Leishmania infantum JPCM5]SUZ46075.1 ubiquitin-protein_ligase_-_putative [Leishmania infantum]|eukprot:XP_001469074.2 conserved hypothetical protein [Leishmania infantum JPCM5]